MLRSSWLAVLAVAFALPVRAGLRMEFEEGPRRTTVEMEGKRFRSTDAGQPERAPRSAGHARMQQDDEADQGPDATPDGEEDEGAAMPRPARHAGRDVTIFDGDKQVLYQLDEDRKTYQRTDERSAGEMAKAAQDYMEKMRATLTPEQRAQMDALMAQQKKPRAAQAPVNHTWKFERAGGSQKVAGYTCERYRVLRDGKPVQEACFIAWGTGGFTKKDFQAMEELGAFVERLQRSMQQRSGQGAGAVPSGDWMTHFVEAAPGFPAVMRYVDGDGSGGQEMRLLKIERTSVAPSRFAIPSDYREKKFSMMGDGEERP